ncbi:MAG: hypothetical protein JWQ42_2356 [Edaphobacter sp.]|nr:hypothetical protein [Edaphobacter sp.]
MEGPHVSNTVVENNCLAMHSPSSRRTRLESEDSERVTGNPEVELQLVITGQCSHSSYFGEPNIDRWSQPRDAEKNARSDCANVQNVCSADATADMQALRTGPHALQMPMARIFGAVMKKSRRAQLVRSPLV